MAYVSKEQKAAIVAALKKVVPASWKYSVSVANHSTLVVTISAAPVDLLAEIARKTGRGHIVTSGNVEVNHYYPAEALGESLPVFERIISACNTGNYDNSDSQTDYFDVGHYVKIRIGRFDKPFETRA